MELLVAGPMSRGLLKGTSSVALARLSCGDSERHDCISQLGSRTLGGWGSQGLGDPELNSDTEVVSFSWPGSRAQKHGWQVGE